MFSNRIHGRYKPVKIVRTDDDIVVQDGLSLSPTQVAEMTRAGIPISPANGMQFYDGDRSLNFDPGLFGRRGVNMIDVWNAQQDSRRKLRDLARSTQFQEGGD